MHNETHAQPPENKWVFKAGRSTHGDGAAWLTSESGYQTDLSGCGRGVKTKGSPVLRHRSSRAKRCSSRAMTTDCVLIKFSYCCNDRKTEMKCTWTRVGKVLWAVCCGGVNTGACWSCAKCKRQRWYSVKLEIWMKICLGHSNPSMEVLRSIEVE